MTEDEFQAFRTRLIDAVRSIFAYAPFVLSIAAFLTALIHDAANREVAWVIVSIAVFPLGILRGIAIWLGLA